MTAPSTPASRNAVTGFALAVVVAAVVSGIANLAIAMIALAMGASDEFGALHPSAYLPLTVIGVVAGTAGWQIVSRRADNPAGVLRWLVPVAVLVSLVPDLAIGFAGGPGVTWGGVAALMLMHVAVAAVAVPVYRLFLPLR